LRLISSTLRGQEELIGLEPFFTKEVGSCITPFLTKGFPGFRSAAVVGMNPRELVATVPLGFRIGVVEGEGSFETAGLIVVGE
jgi:hypothetical protein